MSSRVRFQADADLNHVILLAVVRREPEVDFQSAAAARLEGLSDSQVLAQAAAEWRLLVTHDQATMPTEFARHIATRRSPGVIIVPQHLPHSSAASDLLLVWHATRPEEWVDRICYLPL